MAESIDHFRLVERICEFTKQIIPRGNSVLMFSDSPDSKNKPPKVINGYIPDVYYNFDGLMVIGEAKTDNDIEREHSLSQYKSYLKEASLFSKKSLIIIGVSWKSFSTIKNIFRVLIKDIDKEHIEIFIINNLGHECKL